MLLMIVSRPHSYSKLKVFNFEILYDDRNVAVIPKVLDTCDVPKNRISYKVKGPSLITHF